MEYAALACRGLVGLVFAVSAFTKIRNVTAYREFGRWLVLQRRFVIMGCRWLPGAGNGWPGRRPGGLAARWTSAGRG
jgi:hypothetical protein